MKMKITLICAVAMLLCYIQAHAQTVVKVGSTVTFTASASSCSGAEPESIVAQELSGKKGQTAINSVSSVNAGCNCSGSGDVVNYTLFGVNGNFPANGDFTGQATSTRNFPSIGVDNTSVYYQTRNVKWWYKAGFGCIHDVLSTSSPSYQTIYVEAGLTFTPPANFCANGAPIDLLTLTNKTAGLLKTSMKYTVDGGAEIPIATLLDPSTLSVGAHTIVVKYPFHPTVDQVSKVVTINAIPTSTILGTFPENVCAISGVTYDLNAQVNNPLPAGSTVSFSCVTEGSFLCPSGVLSAGVFNPNAQGGNSFQSKIRVTTTGPTGCVSNVDKIINVGVNFTITPGGAIAACKDASPIVLGGSPANGGGYTTSWSGTGVTGGTHWNPASGSVVAATPYTLTYTANNNVGCIKTATRTATANALPSLSVGGTVPHIADCASGNINLTSTYIPQDNGSSVTSGLTWSSNNSTVNSKISGNILSLTGIAQGNYNITFSYVNANGCVSSYTISNGLAINTGAIEVPAANNATNCGLGLATSLSVLSPDPAISYDWFEEITGGSAIFTGTSYTTPALNASRSYFVAARKASCISSRKQVNITVVNTDVNAGQDYSSCSNVTGSVNLSGLNNPQPSGGTWSGPGVNSGNFNGAALENNKAYKLVYTVNQFGCISRDTINATLGFDTQLTFSPSNEVDPGELLTISHNYPTATQTTWTFGDGSSISALNGNHYYYSVGFKTITVYIKQPGGCDNTFTFNDAVFVKDPPVITSAEKELEGLSVFPVPFAQSLSIQSDYDVEGLLVRLHDINGRLVATQDVKISKGRNEIFQNDVTRLSQGLYILEISNGKTIKRMKLIKQ